MSVEVTLSASNLPSDYCFPGNWNQVLQDMVNNMTGVLAGGVSGVVISKTVPAAADRNKLWVRLNSNGYKEKEYIYTGGVWACEHPISPGESDARIWRGTTTALKTYDGGADAAVTETTGPMWEVDTDFEGRFPVGVGSFANRGDVTVQSGTTSTGKTGVDQHALATEELPAHNHPVDHGLIDGTYGLGDAAVAFKLSVDSPGTTNDRGDGVAHNNLPPFWGVYFIKRTARIYYTAS